MRKNCASGPFLRGDAPSQSNTVTVRGGVQRLICFRIEQRAFTSFTAQLVRDELRPVADRAVHCGSRSHKLRIVDRLAIFPHRLAVFSVWPWLINFAWRAKTSESAARHSKRIENNLAHQVFPGLSTDSLGDSTGKGVSKVGVQEFRSRLRLQFGRSGFL